jgi:hypothetical protein
MNEPDSFKELKNRDEICDSQPGPAAAFFVRSGFPIATAHGRNE